MHPLLFSKNYPFLYVPEEAVLDDGYALKQHHVIILPQAPYLPAEMTDRLLDWIRAGGTLISFGVPGIWNPYGQEDLRLITKVFGRSTVTDQKPGEWQWSWKPLGANPRDEWVKDEAKTIVAARAKFGRGTMLVSTAGYKSAELQRLFYNTLNSAMRRPATCAQDSFELVLRRDSHGGRFLFVLNPDTRRTREDEIILATGCSSCIDLGVGTGVAAPVSVQKDVTRFRLRLHPGEGTVVALGR